MTISWVKKPEHVSLPFVGCGRLRKRWKHTFPFLEGESYFTLEQWSNKYAAIDHVHPNYCVHGIHNAGRRTGRRSLW
jgi:hypothetical protein